MCGDSGRPRYLWGNEAISVAKTAAMAVETPSSTLMGMRVVLEKFLLSPVTATKSLRIHCSFEAAFVLALAMISLSSAYCSVESPHFGGTHQSR